MQKVEIKITGMSCSHCSKSANDFLAETEGVQSVKVDLEKEKAIIEFDKEKLNLEKLLQSFNEELPFKATL
jgi:copper chaperone CopZ